MNISSSPHCYPYPPPPVSHLASLPPPTVQQPPQSHSHPHSHPHPMHHPHPSASPRNSTSLPPPITATMPPPPSAAYPSSAPHQSAYPAPPHPSQTSSNPPFMYPQYTAPSHHPSAYPVTVMSQGSAQLYPPPPQPQPQHQQQPQHSQSLHPSSNPPPPHPHMHVVHHHHPQVPPAYLPRYSPLTLQPHPASFVAPSNLNPAYASMAVNPAAHPPPPPQHHPLSHPHHHPSHPHIPQPTVVSTALVASTPVPQRPLPSERDAFYSKLHTFRDSIGEPIQRLPTLGFKELDLCVLYAEVTKRNGIDAVIANKQWKEVAEALRLPSSCTDSGFRLRLHYKKYLEAFERKYFQPSRPHSAPSIQHPTSSSVATEKHSLPPMATGSSAPTHLVNTSLDMAPSPVPMSSSAPVFVSSAQSIVSDPVCNSAPPHIPAMNSIPPSTEQHKELSQQANDGVCEQNLSSPIPAKEATGKLESRSSSDALSTVSGPTDPGSMSAGSSGSSGSLGAGLSGVGNGTKDRLGRLGGAKKKKRLHSSPPVPSDLNEKLYDRESSHKTESGKDSTKRRDGSPHMDVARTSCNRSTLNMTTAQLDADRIADSRMVSRKRPSSCAEPVNNAKGGQGDCREPKRCKSEPSSIPNANYSGKRQGKSSDNIASTGSRAVISSRTENGRKSDDDECNDDPTSHAPKSSSKVELQKSEVETLLDFIHAVRRC